MSLTAPFSREWRATLVVAGAGVAVLLPIFIWGIPGGADLINHYGFALPFYESIHGGKLYPGWLAESNYGYGDPRFRFYPAGLYYLLATARALTGWYSATALTFSVLSILGGLGVYFWCRSFCSTRIAMWAGVLYPIAPYHLNQLYQASMLAEYASCSVLPFAFAFVDRICRKKKPADVAGLAIAYALLILTHIPLAVIGSLSLFVYGALRIKKELLWQTLIRLALAISLGLAASAFFWTTVLMELPWIKGNSITPNTYYDYRVNFLFSFSAQPGRSTWYANLLGLAVIGSLLPAVVFIKREFFANRRDNSLRAIFLLTTISFLMATELSRPVWAIVPRLQDVQFPWRWLAITSMSGSILIVASIPKWVEKVKAGLRPRNVVPLLGIMLAIFFIVHEVVWEAPYLRGQQFNSLFTTLPESMSFKNWLPIWAHEVPQMKKMKNNVEAESRPVIISSWDREHRTFQIGRGPVTEVRVRTYYYPHWIATSQGKPLGTRPAEDGALLILVPADETSVELEFREPRRVATARFVSALGWILIAALLAFEPGKHFLLRFRKDAEEGKSSHRDAESLVVSFAGKIEHEDNAFAKANVKVE